MEQQILSVDQPRHSLEKATPNLLPCRIHYNGPVGTANLYWTPSQDPDGKRLSYFRGRKLHGKALKIPEGYRGVVAEKKEALKAPDPGPDEPVVIDVDAEDEMPLGALQTRAEFDEMVIWSHESMAQASSDPYVRGVEEWIKMAEQIHSYDAEKRQ